MRTWIEEEILFLHAEDVPAYKKQGSIVRNSFFWALRSIAARAPVGKAWEFESAVWLALQRMLLNFTDSGYLGSCETQLEFREDAVIPKLLQTIATWIPAAEFDCEPEPESRPSWEDGEDAVHSLGAGKFHRAGTLKRKTSSFQCKAKAHTNADERPAPPYSSYIKKQS